LNFYVPFSLNSGIKHRRFVAGLLLRGSGFDARSIQVSFVVQKWH